MMPQAVTEDALHFGTSTTDPNGTVHCLTCRGEGTVPAPPRPCPECHTRQQLRNAWWESSDGPARLRRKLEEGM